MKKLAIKFNFKTFTFFTAGCVIMISLWLVLSPNLMQDEGAKFNSNFKNYNRILDIFDVNGKQIAHFKIALADNNKKRAYGLMNLKSLPEDHGMLFTFYPSQVVSMWMKNTFIPLDMIFIDSDNEIATIAKNTIPHSLEIISSRREVIMVLEINGGISEKLGLKVGQKIRVFNQEK